jgi:hypothetical protein
MLEWKQINLLKCRSDIRIRGLFGIRFECEKMCYNDEYYYRYIINGKRFGGYLGYPCKNFEYGKALCEDVYYELCDKIIKQITESK